LRFFGLGLSPLNVSALGIAVVDVRVRVAR
jgi:hypothetical protein